MYYLIPNINEGQKLNDWLNGDILSQMAPYAGASGLITEIRKYIQRRIDYLLLIPLVLLLIVNIVEAIKVRSKSYFTILFLIAIPLTGSWLSNIFWKPIFSNSNQAMLRMLFMLMFVPILKIKEIGKIYGSLIVIGLLVSLLFSKRGFNEVRLPKFDSEVPISKISDYQYINAIADPNTGIGYHEISYALIKKTKTYNHVFFNTLDNKSINEILSYNTDFLVYLENNEPEIETIIKTHCLHSQDILEALILYYCPKQKN
jgi:hypothetical protein